MSAADDGPAPKQGRPSYTTATRPIKLRPEECERWMKNKESFGFSGSTHSQFAEFLLDNICNLGGSADLFGSDRSCEKSKST